MKILILSVLDPLVRERFGAHLNIILETLVMTLRSKDFKIPKLGASSWLRYPMLWYTNDGLHNLRVANRSKCGPLQLTSAVHIRRPALGCSWSTGLLI